MTTNLSRVAGFFFAVTLVSLSILVAPQASALEDPGAALQEVGVDTSRLGQKLDLSVKFTDQSGETRTLGDMLSSGKPLIVTPVYYHCPRLCGFFLGGFVKLLGELQLELGRDFEIATISFDHEEGVELAAERAAEYRKQLVGSQARTPDAWKFYVGSKPDVTTLMSQLGFRYSPDGGEFAHTAAFIILTPQGEISQYFTGIDFSAWDVKLAMVDASRGAIGSAIDHFLLFCFRFDPTKGKYTWAAFNIMRSGVIFSVLVMGALVYRASTRKGLT